MKKVSVAALLLLLSFSGCTGLILPAVDLDAPGWQVWTGQALWKPAADRPSLAGELIVARRARGPHAGDLLVSFSKPPLPIFTAQTAGSFWRLDFVERGRAYGGRGRAPHRFVWFRLPALLGEGEAPRGWTVDRPAPDRWELEHPRRGEVIRIALDAVPAEPDS